MDASSVKGVLHNKWFYCDHLGSSENDLTDIKTFSVRDPDIAGGLSNYLQNQAFDDENSNAMRTFSFCRITSFSPVYLTAWKYMEPVRYCTISSAGRIPTQPQVRA